MKLLTFRTESGLQLGVKTDRGVLDILESAGADSAVPQSVSQLLKGGKLAFQALAAHVQRLVETGDDQLFLDEDALQFGPCVPGTGKIICIGLNYRKHAAESNMPVPEYPILFNKFANAVAAHGEEIVLPRESQQVDYEAELAIVIGQRAKRVAREEALSYVAGYCNANDLSARDLQFRTHQWLLGKSCDGFCPLGPYLVTADEVGNPNDLAIKAYVNGEIRQHSHTSDMVFPCDELISYISHHLTLEPGDIILTGTPAGVIMGYPKEKQVWLQDGDDVIVEIEKLGQLRNRMWRETE
ncbi:fumarylacetoacetate hydrolase family protein [Brevibacillus sp. SYP-B805]|uniref:fumarylacetoacetate hydrolase family protein n=1 Tax=Brevibacillus sp. SYP-B805 TaxID=1578199 RepID=UPI0013EC63E0|nr:fumarylacetoacetate hydrolase family protein [Brevibacillus sp. SYP-B805]NGQ94948.1 fumarylacetoacetate hydrolase family protein [Brevibacillus sp. SYP-B805]